MELELALYHQRAMKTQQDLQKAFPYPPRTFVRHHDTFVRFAPAGSMSNNGEMVEQNWVSQTPVIPRPLSILPSRPRGTLVERGEPFVNAFIELNPVLSRSLTLSYDPHYGFERRIQLNTVARNNLHVKLSDLSSCLEVRDGKRVHIPPFDRSIEGPSGNIFELALQPYYPEAHRSFKAIEADPAEFCIVADKCDDEEPNLADGGYGPLAVAVFIDGNFRLSRQVKIDGEDEPVPLTDGLKARSNVPATINRPNSSACHSGRSYLPLDFGLDPTGRLEILRMYAENTGDDAMKVEGGNSSDDDLYAYVEEECA
uniref:Uncharacterized protein n=1 Tax=Mycena chlorophos TaxID=658473 RepID=A0ABQ0LD32_MYCCL|nr:predicted protein [Mycena chlorophos]